jgi:Ni/Co efflux regulator RcnB
MMHGPSHADWRQGGHIAHNDWNRGRHVDYRGRHLRKPPRGYEWREVDGNYVLAAAATGLIASIILANQ